MTSGSSEATFLPLKGFKSKEMAPKASNFTVILRISGQGSLR